MIVNPYKYITNIKEKSYTDAQKALQKGLIELNQNYEIHDISIKELCKSAHVARSTFYAYYNNVIELQEDIENDLVYNLLKLNDDFRNSAIKSEEDLEFFKNTYNYILENKQIFYTFLITNPNVRFIEKWKEAIKYHFWECLFCNGNSRNDKFVLELISTQAVTGFAFWLKNPYDVNMKDVNEIIIQTLNILK